MLFGNKFLILFIALSLCFSFTKRNTTPYALADKDPIMTVSNYLNSLEEYCEKYKDEHRIYIEDQLLIHPSTYFANDIDGIYNSDCEASLYFLNLKENNVKITFGRKFTIETCQINGEQIYGTKVTKNVKSTDGREKKFTEFIELREINNQRKIISTISDLFQNYDQIICAKEAIPQPQTKPQHQTKPQNPKKEECKIFDLAESEYKKGNRSKALEYYKLALNCEKNKKYVNTKIEELNTVNNIKAALKKGHSVNFLSVSQRK